MRCEQLSLTLFSPPTFEHLIRPELMLRVVLNSRLKRGWHVRQLPDGVRELTLPAYFGNAPEEIKKTLIAWALLPIRSKRAKRERKGLERSIWHYAQTIPEAGSRRKKIPQWSANAAVGCRFDLRELFDELNRTYFGGRLSSQVRWGRKGSMTSYQLFRSGPEGEKASFITIAGAYNRPDVPRFAVEGVLFHEMAHEALPPTVRGGRRSIHGREFRNLERSYPLFAQWREWERLYLGRSR